MQMIPWKWQSSHGMRGQTMAKRLIYAEDVLEILDRDKAYMSDVGRIHAKNAVNEAPTVGQKKGRWIHPKGYVVSNGFLCSECGHQEASLYPINPRPGGVCLADEHGNFYHPPKMNYCPECGADMRGEEDGK
jgi:hypothetical protein